MLLAPGGISPVYQPVYDLRNGREAHSYECLSRGPRGSNFESAKVLFDYVRLKREESLIDRACIAAALRSVNLLGPSACVSVNVHASTLGRDHGFVSFLRRTTAEASLPMDQVTVEVVEHAPPWDGVSFLAALDEIRASGARIALDDVGLGQSNFKMILDVGADYLKLDRYFVDGCHRDVRRQAVIQALQQLASRFGAKIIAEGIETVDDLNFIERLGINLVQGFLFAPPFTPDEIVRGALHDFPSSAKLRIRPSA